MVTFVDGTYVAIQRTFTISPPPPPPPPGCVAVPLDTIPQPLAAYGLRQLLTAYTANKAIRVWRDSDSAELDIGFAAPCNYLDIAALLAFSAGATNVTVVKWYDQSGNGLDIASLIGEQNTSPLIVASGVLVSSIGGRPAMLFGTNTAHLKNFTPVSLSATQNSFFAVGNSTAGATTAFNTEGSQGYNLFCASDASIGANGPFYGIGFGQSGSASAPCMNAWRNTDWFWVPGQFIQTPVSYTFGTDAIWANRWNTGETPVSKSYVNGGTPGTNNNSAATATGHNTNLLLQVGIAPIGGASYTGSVAELIVYASELSVANSNSYGNNAATFFTLTWTNIT